MQYNKCKEIINNVNSDEQAKEIKDIFQKILYSIEYYDKKQEEIIRKSINSYAKISKRLNLDLQALIEEIRYKINEINANSIEQIEDISIRYNNEEIPEER